MEASGSGDSSTETAAKRREGSLENVFDIMNEEREALLDEPDEEHNTSMEVHMDTADEPPPSSCSTPCLDDNPLPILFPVSPLQTEAPTSDTELENTSLCGKGDALESSPPKISPMTSVKAENKSSKQMVSTTITNFFSRKIVQPTSSSPRTSPQAKCSTDITPPKRKYTKKCCHAVSLLSDTKLTIKTSVLRPEPKKPKSKRSGKKTLPDANAKKPNKRTVTPKNDAQAPKDDTIKNELLEKPPSPKESSEAPTTLSAEPEAVKRQPKARKSFKGKQASTNLPARPFPSLTFKLTDVESVLGIEQKSISKLDSKTLDKIILQKALQPKTASTPLTPVAPLKELPKEPPVKLPLTTKNRKMSIAPKRGNSYHLPLATGPKTKKIKSTKVAKVKKVTKAAIGRMKAKSKAKSADLSWMDVRTDEEDELKLSEVRKSFSAATVDKAGKPKLKTAAKKKKKCKGENNNSSQEKSKDQTTIAVVCASYLKNLSLANQSRAKKRKNKLLTAKSKKKRKLDDNVASSSTTSTPASTPSKDRSTRGISPRSPRGKHHVMVSLLDGKTKTMPIQGRKLSKCDGYINTPNGISYPVTPPYTPEEGSTASASSDETPEQQAIRGVKEGDVTPVCSCTVDGYSFTNLTIPRYCQALDTVDNKTVGCSNKSFGVNLYRPSLRVPFLALCQMHRQRLHSHQCCPQCGQFCTQGKFYQCKLDSTKGVNLHHYHTHCATLLADLPHCPHCARPSTQDEVVLKLNEPRSPWCFKNRFRPKEPRPIAKICPVYPALLNMKAKEEEGEEASPDAEIPVAGASDKVISTKGLSLGPDREALQKAMSVLQIEKPKSYKKTSKSLYIACRAKDLERALYLMVEGCDPCEISDNKQTPLHAVADSGANHFVHLLIQAGANINAQDDTLRTPLMNAAEKGHVDALKSLLKAGAFVELKSSDGMTALHFAAKSGNLASVKLLLRMNNADINVRDDGGWTPVIWAAEHRHLTTVQYLLESGADPCLKDNEENSGLHWASFSGSVDIAEMFINAGCDMESPNEHGDRPLHIAARQDHYECVVLFLLHQADVEGRNNENDSPLSVIPIQNSATYRALYVYKELHKAKTSRTKLPLRLLHRDISYGREANPVPVVNDCDDENYPNDFLYVQENVETVPLNINRTITSLRSCVCQGDCSSLHCVCGHSSIRCWFTKEGLLKDDFNYSDPPLLFECNKACHCWASCQNRVVQLGINVRLQVFRTIGRGWGCRTLQNVKKGSFVCEYVGELISDAEAESREDDSYLFDLDNKDVDTFCVDARKYGNVARFINHLCYPNLVPVKVFIEHQDLRFPRICFFASRDIVAGEELGFDYGDKFWVIKWKQFTCCCGSDFCRYSNDRIQSTISEYNKRMADEETSRADL